MIIGLTGSIAMGKSHISKHIKQLCTARIFDADEQVRKLLATDKDIIVQTAELFPKAVQAQKIDRRILGDIVFADDTKLKQLEAIIHPAIQVKRQAFIQRCTRQRMVGVLDIPLLFETEADKVCDKVIVVDVPFWVQKKRALQRKHMTLAKFQAILDRQIPSYKKCQRADAVIDGVGSTATTYQQLTHIVYPWLE